MPYIHPRKGAVPKAMGTAVQLGIILHVQWGGTEPKVAAVSVVSGNRAQCGDLFSPL